jgi:hypothetical protein
MQSYHLKTLSLRNNNYRNTPISKEVVPILYDLVDLSYRQLINNTENHVFGLTDVNPAEFIVHGLGVLLYQMMELNKIEDTDIIKLSKLLS